MWGDLTRHCCRSRHDEFERFERDGEHRTIKCECGELAVVRQFTDLIAQVAGDPNLTERTWVLITEAPDGGWGLAGHANTNAELITAARAQIAQLSAEQSETTTD